MSRLLPAPVSGNPSLPPAALYRIALSDPSQPSIAPETVFTAATTSEIAAWIEEWLTDPLGYTVHITAK